MTHLEENFNSINQEKHHDDEQQHSVAPIKQMTVEAGIVWWWFSQARRNHLRQQQTVTYDVKRDKSQQRLGQEVRLVPANALQVENLNTKQIYYRLESGHNWSENNY